MSLHMLRPLPGKIIEDVPLVEFVYLVFTQVT